MILPLRLPVIDSFLNRLSAKIWPFYWFDLTHIIVAKPLVKKENLTRRPTVSVVVPVRNEEGNIKKIFADIPEIARFDRAGFCGSRINGSYICSD